MCLDTAETENKRSNPTAATIWGVFEYVEPKTERAENHAILLHSYSEKLEFHRLKKVAKEWIKTWKPDTIMVEAKSTGPALRSELAEAGIFTSPERPKPGEDKNVRLASVADIFHSNRVWYMPTAANEVTLQQVADFPNGEFDDLVDTVSYCLRKFRKGGFVKTVNDEDPVEDERPPVRREYY
jgi:predicted phage terminase large subunit-like protein